MIDLRTSGLIMFCTVQAVNVIALLLDLVLAFAGCATVTDYARRHAWFCAWIFVFNAAGLFGLALHFRPEK